MPGRLTLNKPRMVMGSTDHETPTTSTVKGGRGKRLIVDFTNAPMAGEYARPALGSRSATAIAGAYEHLARGSDSRCQRRRQGGRRAALAEGVRVDYGQEAARRYPGRFATMGRVNLDDPAERERAPRMREQPAVLGARLFFQRATAHWLSDGTADWFWRAAEQARLPVMFLTIGQTPLFGPIAERHPELPLIIDHMGSIEAVKERFIAARVAEAAALAKYPNVSVKLSSIPALFRAGLSMARHGRPHQAIVRRLWRAALPLGNRPHQLLRSRNHDGARHALYRRTEVPVRGGQGLDYGQEHLAEAGLDLTAGYPRNYFAVAERCRF